MPEPQDATIVQPPDKGVVTVYRTKSQLMAANFLGGLAWGFGSVVGATIVVGLLIFLLQALGGIPLIGAVINDLIETITTRQ